MTEDQKIKSLAGKTWQEKLLNIMKYWGVNVARDEWSDQPMLWCNSKDKWVAIEVPTDKDKDLLMQKFNGTQFNWTEPTQMSNGNWLIKASIIGLMTAISGNTTLN